MTILKRKWILVMLMCLMFAGFPLMDAVTQTVLASPDYLFTVHMVVGTITPRWGYHDMAAAIKTELAKIGINVEIHFMDTGAYYDLTWSNWDKTWDEGGWDMDIWGYIWMLTDLIWFEGCFSADGQVPLGWNYWGWQNEKADDLLRSCMTTNDAELRKIYIDKWQEEYMHDPPNIPLYYPRYTEIINAEVENWNPNIMFLDAVNLKFANSTPEEYHTLRYGGYEDMEVYNPVFIVNLADDTYFSLTFDMLYETAEDPETGGVIIVPCLASGMPEYTPDGKNVTVNLRDDVYWHNGRKFNATDVKFTFDAVIDPDTGSPGYGDFSAVIDWVEIEDEYTVVFHLKELYAPFNSLLANTWGAFIVPEYELRGVPHSDWKTHSSNTETPLIGTGAYMSLTRTPDVSFEVVVNPNYFEGEGLIDKVIYLVMTDPTAALIALQTGGMDMGNAWDATRAEIEEMSTWDHLNVFDYDYPASDWVSFNLHHPILSNRYVRLAIAHMLPYEHIISNILEGYALRAKTPVCPIQGYFFNWDLPYYETNQTKAQQYLDMWLYSLDNDTRPGNADPAVYNLGPVGDGDFSGLVESDDFVVWANRIVEGQLTPGTWPFIPGQPIDPDFDNTAYVEMADYNRWRENIGERYPFDGAW